MMRLLSVFGLLLLMVIPSSHAQEMWGISNSNYAGNMGIFLNPSTIVHAPYRYELNLIAFDGFAENNYFFSPRDRHFVPRTLFGGDVKERAFLPETAAGYYDGFSHLLVIGPSYIRNHGDHAWGIHTALRASASAQNFPEPLARLLYERYGYAPYAGRKFESEKTLRSDIVSWYELGGTYGRVVFDSEKHMLKWAVSGNLLIGTNALHLQADPIAYSVADTGTVIATDLDARLRYALDPEGSTLGNLLAPRGAGLGTTIGVTYFKPFYRGGFDCNRSNDRVKKYKYRIGASLIDIGHIRWFRQTTQVDINAQGNRAWTQLDSLRFSSMQAVQNSAVNALGGTISDAGFGSWLPTALSVQADYSILPTVYANLSWVNRIRFAPNQAVRGNQVTLSARYETRNFEANINSNLYEYERVHLGLGLRYRFLVIGTDRLPELLGLNNTRSFDLYFGLKFQSCTQLFKRSEPDCPGVFSLR
jgi:hypothetical protein